ncbi:MAG TPA: FkbM family methyltransferase [Solirubrobacteraceae bacterium]|nr:FkbM family methyltransferase [Solirubrobacteraceae bacterium]
MPRPSVRGVLRHARRYVQGDRTARRAQERDWFFRAAARFTPVLAVDSELGRILVSSNDDAVGRATFIHGGYDYETISTIIALLERAVPGWPHGGVILEVGANIGTTTLMLARHADVIAFEPVPGNLEILRCNVVANQIDDRVTVRGVAVSDVAGFVTMELSGANSGDHRVRLTDRNGSLEEADRDTIRVPTIRLDDDIGDQPVALVWIDAQGHEAQILAGASRLLASGTPIVIEYWPYGLRRADGLERLEALVAENFTTVIDTSRAPGDDGHILEPGALSTLRDRYPQPSDYTDLLLVSA